MALLQRLVGATTTGGGSIEEVAREAGSFLGNLGVEPWGSSPFQPEVHQVLWCSTGHLPHDLAQRMEANEDIDEIPIFYRMPYGWFMKIEMDQTDREAVLDARMTPLVAFCHERGISWVRFDQDANRVDQLPYWEW